MTIDTEPTGAVFSDERTHRLYLWRRWNKTGGWVMFIGLNPSTADERLNDPTIRRCIGFARDWGYGGLFMCNVYTLVSTDPSLLNIEMNVAMGAHLAMRTLRERSDVAVAAWGSLITKVWHGKKRIKWIKDALSPLHCLGLTKQGHPRHPLYLRKDTKLVEFGGIEL